MPDIDDESTENFLDQLAKHPDMLRYPCGCVGFIGPGAPDDYQFDCPNCGKKFAVVVINGKRSLQPVAAA